MTTKTLTLAESKCIINQLIDSVYKPMYKNEKAALCKRLNVSVSQRLRDLMQKDIKA